MHFNPIFLLMFVAVNTAFADCQTGYAIVSNVADSTFTPPVNDVCQISGYTLMTLPDGIDMLYTGQLIGNPVTLCNDGHLNGNTCVSYQQGSCTNGNFDTAVADSTFTPPVNDVCQISGYTLSTLPDGVDMLYTGQLIGNPVTLCDNGHLVNGSCVPYTSGDCIDGYVDLATDINTFTATSGGACSNPYITNSDFAYCDNKPGTACVNAPSPSIAINWVDGETTLEAGSCIYGESIELPSEPTKAGYKFVGWRVVNE